MEPSKKNLWILTEERPKDEVLHAIINKFCSDNHILSFVDNLRIIPILNNEGKFLFVYELLGVRSEKINKIYIKTVSGNGSFVDFMVFYQENEPKEGDEPIYAIEETKTDDSESRNTGVLQRASKFVYINEYYHNAKKIMLYNLQVQEKEEQTDTNIFGTKCLLTLGVEILGKENNKVTSGFSSIDELINFKNGMRRPPAGNVPILLEKKGDIIEISGRLLKDDSLAHDPNIGGLTLLSGTLRNLGWNGRIIITRHGLSQRHVAGTNKFIQIAGKVGIELEGLVIRNAVWPEKYWHYETKGEKLGTIFLHLIVENFTTGRSIFENHAGCEKGYFIKKDGTPIPLKKYTDKEAYKKGDKSKKYAIPDLILLDVENLEIVNIEGKKYSTRKKGIKELNDYDPIENDYIKPEYPEYQIIRTVVLYGSKQEEILEIEVGFLLNEKGKLILGIKAPKIFREAVQNVLDFWKS